MISLVSLLFLSMWDKPCFVNMHHFPGDRAFFSNCMHGAPRIWVRYAAADTGAVLEGLGGFFFVVAAVLGHVEGYFNSAFSSKMGLESFTRSS